MKNLKPKSDEELMKFLNNILDEYNVSVKWIGRQYIKDIVVILLNDSSVLKSLSTTVYPELGEYYKTKGINVEKSVRNAISKSTYPNAKNTSNKAFLLDIFEKLKLFFVEKP